MSRTSAPCATSTTAPTMMTVAANPIRTSMRGRQACWTERSPSLGEGFRLFEHEIMVVIGSDDQHGVFPSAVRFDPTADDVERHVSAVDRSDHVVDVVGVLGPVDVAGFDHEPEFAVVTAEHIERRGGVIGQRRIL